VPRTGGGSAESSASRRLSACPHLRGERGDLRVREVAEHPGLMVGGLTHFGRVNFHCFAPWQVLWQQSSHDIDMDANFMSR
jgi:hypothetical protein